MKSLITYIDSVKQQYILLFLLILFAATTAFNLLDIRPIFCDECWYTNPAYNFFLGGWIKNTNVGSGGDLNFLFPFIQGLLFKVFGFSFYMARFASVIGGLFSIYFLYLVFKTLSLKNTSILISCTAFTGIIMYHHAFTMARPESWAVAFSLFSIVYLLKFYNNRKTYNIVISGVGCGLAFLAHPDTLAISVLIGFSFLLLLIKSKQLLHVLWFLLPVVTSGILFLINQYLVYGNMFSDGISSRSIGNSGILSNFLSNLTASAGIFTIASKTKIVNAVFLTCFLLIGLFFRKRHRVLFYSSLMGVGVWFISIFVFSATAYLFLYVFIFAIINLAIITDQLRKYQPAFLLFAFVLIASAVASNYTRTDNIHTILKNDLKEEVIPSHAKTFGPLELWCFVPNVKYATYNYRPNQTWKEVEVQPDKMDYFIYSQNVDMGQDYIRKPLVRKFLDYENKELVYEQKSVYYTTIQIYKLN